MNAKAAFLLVGLVALNGLAFADTPNAAQATSSSPEAVATLDTIDPPETTVSVRGAQGTTQEMATGATLLSNDHVITKPGQTVIMKLKDDSEVTAAPKTDLAVTDYIPSQPSSVPHVELNQGTAHFDVTKAKTAQHSFFIRTKSATMGVRGTEFVVEQRTDGYSIVHTLDGKVGVAKTETELDQPNRSAEVSAGRTTFMHPSMSVPASPKNFNRKEYLTQLSKTYPSLMKQVQKSHQQQMERAAKDNNEERTKSLKAASDEKKNLPPKRIPRPKKKKQ